MKIIIIACFSCLYLLSAIKSTGQVRNTDTLLFEKAIVLEELIDDLDLERTIGSGDTTKAQYATEIKTEILEKLLKYYAQIVDSFPKSKMHFRALNNRASIELELGKYNKAEQSFLALLKSAADDKERGGTGTGIMSEPYANYKNRAAKSLATIYLRNKDYKLALKYLACTKKYPYRHFCGNAFAEDKIYIATLYGQCYLGLKNYTEAYNTLLPYIIYNGLADNSEIVDLAYKSLLINYTKPELKRKFENAVKHCHIIDGDINDPFSSGYSITFLGVKIEITGPIQFDLLSKTEKEKAIKKDLLKSKFYLLLT